MILIECQQGEPEWFAPRAGVITASNFAESRRRLKSGKNKGDFTTAAHNYAFNLAIERIKGAPLDSNQYDTYHMRRGRELEPEARARHEKYLGGVFIEQAGVALTDDRLFGYSTDGFIGDDGMSEYKCFTDADKVRQILFDQSTDDVADQVQGGMWITGRSWCDFVLYYPDLAEVGLDLVVIRIKRDEEYIEELAKDLLLFNELVVEYEQKIATLAAGNQAIQEIHAGAMEDDAPRPKKGSRAESTPYLSDEQIEDLF